MYMGYNEQGFSPCSLVEEITSLKCGSGAATPLYVEMIPEWVGSREEYISK